MNAVRESTDRATPARLTIFAFIWASQALVHQAFFPAWVVHGSTAGWLATLFAVATLLNPRSLSLFSGLLFFNLLYNFSRWPSVANHIFLEFLVELTILLAIIFTAYRERVAGNMDQLRLRESIFDRFSPILIAMLVVVYYVILVSKLNWDFVNIDLSCVAGMYQDVVDRFDFLPIPTETWAKKTALWTFLAVELIVPLCLTFRKTRYIGMLIALPFHLLLGLIGHWTFSAMVFALYSVICIAPLSTLLSDIRQRLPDSPVQMAVKAARILVPGIAAILTLTYFLGQYTEPTGPFYLFRYAFHLWFFWSCLLGTLYVVAVLRILPAWFSMPAPHRLASPGWLWLLFAIVTLNGLSPYLGLKTESSYAMYSNLRTEGGINNHMFMPALRLATYQDDLVEVVATDHPTIRKLSSWHPLGDRTRTPRKKLVPYFELRRNVGDTRSDFYVEYIRNGETKQYVMRNGVSSDPDLAQPLPYLSAKLLSFRPVFATEQSLCQH